MLGESPFSFFFFFILSLAPPQDKPLLLGCASAAVMAVVRTQVPKAQEKTLLSGQKNREKGPVVRRLGGSFPCLLSPLPSGHLAAQTCVTAQEDEGDRNTEFPVRGLGKRAPGSHRVSQGKKAEEGRP